MPPILRSRQVNPPPSNSKSTPTKSASKTPAAALDSSQELSKSARERRRSVRLASKGKMTSSASDSRVDDDPKATKKTKFGTDDLYLSLRSGSRIEKRGSPDRNTGKGKAVDSGLEIGTAQQDSDLLSTTRLSREDKGKGVMMMDSDGSVDLELKLGVGASGLDAEPQPELQVDAGAAVASRPNNVIVEQRMRQHKEIAKQNASRFARVSSMERSGDEADSDADRERVIEDWPGPFSTAMNIVRDRRDRASGQAQHFRLDKTGAPTVIWEPTLPPDHQHITSIVPSLQDLSMQALVNNSHAITSLEFVPDVLVHKLVSMLCDSRRMTADILHLLFQGSPSEICITDCSWIEEEQFKKSFKPCNTQNLMVLQLDQCGRCMPDYVVLETLANKGLPALTTLSLKGACRLSDDGLKALISSAPALKSLNLSQCSLITDTGVKAVADSLRSGLRELYLDDCQSLNVMLLMPVLERLTHLEVLSLVGIPGVCDKFLNQLLGSIGRNIKELALANCVKLSDSTLRVISKNCSQLCALDLINVTKLTDSGIGYLASCCQAIQSLKLCRNSFSDEAIAAFLEACGESLKELSLNNVSEVGPHTCISIARGCKNLVNLDVSWCRNLTDECLGLIADSCESLRVLKVFGCTQITSTFWAGHSNQDLRVIGINLTPILENLNKRDLQQGPLRYSAVFPSD